MTGRSEPPRPVVAKRGPSPAGDSAAGKRLYWHGATASGAPLQAAIAGDAAVAGTQFGCVNCHRPSGFGSSEGGKYVPPITGPILFSPRQLNRNRIYTKLFEEAQPAGFAADVRMPRMRPAYTDQTLADALRKGVDPAGRKLDAQMPRYALSDRDAANLIAYLKTLSAAADPGVDAAVIHFATVVSDGTDPAERAAVVSTITAFFDWMNRATHGYQSRPGFSPYHMSELASAFRHWQLHVWELHGPPATWPQQIQRQYDAQPVFAVISGLVHGPWRPLAQFCDAKHMPCVFPNTELPRTTNTDYAYSLYFSRGLTLEGEVLARYLGRRQPQADRIALVHSTDPYGTTPARAFERALKTEQADARIREFAFSDQTELNAAVRELASAAGNFDALVLLPGERVNAALTALGEWRPGIKVIGLPSDALTSVQPGKLGTLAGSLLFAYPYELPSAYHPRSFRVRQWMHAQHLDIAYPRLQFQTYYALTMAEFALDQILDDFFRDYFIEAIEHEAENNLDIGTHPTLALGPGQRFASKGAYIVRIDAAAPGGIRALSDWIVP
ncbi:MAG: ABC transporter substrate-binding protein [Gammaproteobacteria bacterium]|nr:ABC transporter substrate-binding protein [Gammaproteobacteria bacterium]